MNNFNTEYSEDTELHKGRLSVTLKSSVPSVLKNDRVWSMLDNLLCATLKNSVTSVLKNILYLIFILPTFLLAQQNLPLNREWGVEKEKCKNHLQVRVTLEKLIQDSLGKRKCNFSPNDYSCFKPYIVAIKPQIKDKFKKLTKRKLKEENLFIIRDSASKFYLTIDPLFNFEFGKDFADSTGEKLYKNTRGFLVRGSIGSDFAFETSFYENQSTFVQYIDDYIKSTDDLFPQTNNYDYNVVPGQGRAKAFRTNGYDYAMASGYVSYSPHKIINIQVGHGKHFVGDGYRSLLLSDNSFNYPYARITTTFKNVQYTNLYTSFMNLTNGGVKTPPNVERLFQKKVGSFQLLSGNFFNRLQLGIFQGMIWEAADATNHQNVNFNTFNPIFGINSGIYGLHNRNNIVLGATMKFKITNSISLYSQYMLDDVYNKTDVGEVRKKHGYQIGVKYFDVFKIKNLHFQAEYNNVRPYSYASANTYQSYTHYNQALAHPLGANFYEAVGFINYRFKDFFIQLKVNYAVKGNDSASNNFGGNIFIPDNIFPLTQDLQNISTTQGLKTTIMYQDIHIGYLVNPSTNFNIILGVSNRLENNYKTTKQTQFIYFGIRTSLANFYYDF